jgi:hypothetical protein
MPVAKMERSEKRIRTTVSLPQPVYEEARSVVDSNASSAETMNGFFVNAIVSYLKLIRRKQIDAQFAAMSEDSDYQKDAKLISEEFSQSDWEAFDLAEKER